MPASPPTRAFVLRCDSCGQPAPDVVGPILRGIENWMETTIDGEHEGRRWEADVLLCGVRHNRELGCAPRMRRYIDGGGSPAEAGARPNRRAGSTREGQEGTNE